MSFVDRKLRLFDERRDNLIRRRSEARLKKYGSVYDARAWCSNKEDQRQYILELILKRSLDCTPKLIPTELLLQFMMAEKDALIAKLQNQVKEYENTLNDNQTQSLMYREGKGDAPQGNANLRNAPSGVCCQCTEQECTLNEVQTFNDDELTRNQPDCRENLWKQDCNMVATESSGVSSGETGDAPPITSQPDIEEIQRYCSLAESAIEQLERIKDIVDEKGDFTSNHATQHSTECGKDIEELESEIEAMRKRKLTPVEEADLIKKEVEVLKKYCSQLGEIQKENSELKRERDLLKSQLTPSSDNCLCYELENLSVKMDQMEELKKERDKLKIRVAELENELQKYMDLPDKIDNFKTTSTKIFGDYNDLKERFGKMTGLEEDVKSLKNKVRTSAKTTDEIENLDWRCKHTQQELGLIENEICLLTCKLKEKELEVQQYKEKAKDVDCITMERNCLAKRLESLKFIYEDVMKKVCGCEEMKKKLCELLEIEKECCELRKKARKFNKIERERDELKEEVECCQGLIDDHEEEIARLLNQIDILTQQQLESGDNTKLLIREVKEKEKLLMEKHQQFTEKIKALQNYVVMFKADLEKEKMKNCRLFNEFQKHHSFDVTDAKKENQTIKRDLLKSMETNKRLSDALEKERQQVERLQKLIECSKMTACKKNNRPQEGFYTV